MSFSLTQILLFIIAYLTGLFTVAQLADSGVIPRRITHHPATYVLSLGVLAGAMATNGVMPMTNDHGFNFLLYYIGVVTMFVFAALLLLPLFRLCRVYQLSSLADVLTFRFRSPWAGAAVALTMAITLMPLLALQIQAIAESISLLSGERGHIVPGAARYNQLALVFCIIITGFSILFGTRHRHSQERNTGLVTAIAFESLVKLSALLILMLAALFGVFEGPGDLQAWLEANPQHGATLRESFDEDIGRTLLLVFFAGAVCMPHIFHMTFAEKNDSRDLSAATWGLPLFLLLLALPILPLVWANIKMGGNIPLEFSGLALGMALQSVPLSALAFIASLSAASATIIVTTLALANMTLTHLFIPLRVLRTDTEQSLYSQLRWGRRILISVIIASAYLFYVSLDGSQSLTELALVAFAGTLQLFPGVVAAPYWHRANRKGLLAGMAGGLLLWLFGLLFPMVGNYDPVSLNKICATLSGVHDNAWTAVTLVATGVNTLILVVVSLATRTSKGERVAAEICSMDSRSRATRQILNVRSADEFAAQLAPALGKKTAQSEVALALEELQFSPDETRSYALRRLRARLEANLSGLLGPAAANRIIETRLPFQPGRDNDSEDLHLIERDLDAPAQRFTGLAADLDNLRRHHRETLDKLPVGALSLNADDELLMWNRSMERITSIESDAVLGSLLSAIPAPWNDVLSAFQAGQEEATPRCEVVLSDSSSRWINLHKAAIGGTDRGDTVILVEDVTDYEMLESELLHNERLASIGRLAAGVAHEIGNPVTGIACLAQNLEYETEPDDIRDVAQDILKQTDRVTRIVESLMNFSHTGNSSSEVQLIAANLADCVDEAIHLLSLDRDARPVMFRNECHRELLVKADSQRLLQVFVNILGNARDACDEFGEIHVRAHTHEQEVTIEVEDTGCGIPADMQGHVFEPFFTTKDPGAGTGLGLALVYSIMEDMQGRITITSPVFEGPRPGTRISLYLQRASYEPALQL